MSAARAVPSSLASKETSSTGNDHILIQAGTANAIVQFMAVLYLTEKSELVSFRDVMGDNCHGIVGLPHAVEWDCMQAVAYMAFHAPSINLSMKAGAITIQMSKYLRSSKLLNTWQTCLVSD